MMDVPNPELNARDGRRAPEPFPWHVLSWKVLIRNVLPEQELPLVGQGLHPTLTGWAAAPGQKELADAVFYQLLWKPAAILIISCSRIGQVLLPSAQPSWPQSTGWTTSSTWQGHVEMDMWPGQCRVCSGSGC